eukprot:jgi/Botrbrau1/7273/Bobra.0318s0011.1
MGHKPHWEGCHGWPLKKMAPDPHVVFLHPGRTQPGSPGETKAGSIQTVSEAHRDTGLLAGRPPSLGQWRWEHQVESWKHPKGFSRYDAMIRLTRPIQYKDFGACGHVVFTGLPLQEPLTLIGAASVSLHVSSSDTDADVFVYLQDYSPASRKSRYVTEGCFRASMRACLPEPPKGDVRAAAHLAGEPFHTYTRADAQPLQPGVPSLCEFQLLPTAYTFAPGHCLRISVSGSDEKHFRVDHSGPRTIWLHSGPSNPSSIVLPRLST